MEGLDVTVNDDFRENEECHEQVNSEDQVKADGGHQIGLNVVVSSG